MSEEDSILLSEYRLKLFRKKLAMEQERNTIWGRFKFAVKRWHGIMNDYGRLDNPSQPIRVFLNEWKTSYD